MGRTSNARAKLLQVTTDLLWQHGYNSVSVDQICSRAGVKKGSFYHFFSSKADLAVAALEDHWNTERAQYDRIFSAQIPPLGRLKRYCDAVYEMQKRYKKSTGKVVGCPFASVGCELSAHDEDIRKKAEEVFVRICRYFEVTLRDAAAGGRTAPDELAERAACIHSFILGKLLQAKIENNAEVLKELYQPVLRLIGGETAPAGRRKNS
jgi:TetR/AcrR family transcriptional repressor of nem operon